LPTGDELVGKRVAAMIEGGRTRLRTARGEPMKPAPGTNVQKRLIALHHLDASRKPAEMEQREGSILRQGNDYPEVAIDRYVLTIVNYL